MVAEALTETAAVDLARGFKALGDPVRLRLLSLIAARAGGEVCVCDLTEAFDVTGPTISHHLKVLREAGFVSCRTAAQQRIYRIEVGPFTVLDAWLEPYRSLWKKHLDALERHLDNLEAQ